MKRKAIIVGVVLCVVMAIAIAVKLSRPATLFDANVEALSRSESGFGRMCSQTGTSGRHRMPLCSSCSSGQGYYAMDAVAFCKL